MWSARAMSTLRVFIQRSFSQSSRSMSGLDLLSLEKNHSPGREEFYFDFLYGIHPISCALEAKRRSIQTVFYRRDLVDHNQRVKEILERCWADNIKTQPVSQNKIDTITEKAKSHQGLIAKASRLYYTPAPCTQQFVNELTQTKSSKQVWLFLNEIQDPMNFGSILRSAYFLGCDKILVSAHKSCSLTPVVSKASSGVMELFPIHSVYNTMEFCQNLKELQWDIVGTGSVNTKVAENSNNSLSVPVGSFRLQNPTLIILGNEGQGLPKELVNLCSHHIYIGSRKDLNKNVDSMNVSAAAAVILHCLLNNRE